MERLVVVIPAYNEQAMVGRVVGEVLQELKSQQYAGISSCVIVVDDGSKDDTSSAARGAGGIVLRHTINRGLGASIGTGFEAAKRLGATILLTLDADGQHDPKQIYQVISPVLEKRADFVIGSRLMNPEGMPWQRRLINQGANLVTWLLFGVRSTDSQSGFRAFSSLAIEKIRISTNRMEVSSELLGEAHRLRLRIVEVPIHSIYTDYSKGKGQSSVNSIAVLFKLIIRKLR
jgi:glycosyltransferase involved in cell wall biosynthesis